MPSLDRGTLAAIIFAGILGVIVLGYSLYIFWYVRCAAARRKKKNTDEDPEDTEDTPTPALRLLPEVTEARTTAELPTGSRQQGGLVWQEEILRSLESRSRDAEGNANGNGKGKGKAKDQVDGETNARAQRVQNSKRRSDDRPGSSSPRKGKARDDTTTRDRKGKKREPPLIDGVTNDWMEESKKRPGSGVVAAAASIPRDKNGKRTSLVDLVTNEWMDEDPSKGIPSKLPRSVWIANAPISSNSKPSPSATEKSKASTSDSTSGTPPKVPPKPKATSEHKTTKPSPLSRVTNTTPPPAELEGNKETPTTPKQAATSSTISRKPVLPRRPPDHVAGAAAELEANEMQPRELEAREISAEGLAQREVLQKAVETQRRDDNDEAGVVAEEERVEKEPTLAVRLGESVHAHVPFTLPDISIEPPSPPPQREENTSPRKKQKQKQKQERRKSEQEQERELAELLVRKQQLEARRHTLTQLRLVQEEEAAVEERIATIREGRR